MNLITMRPHGQDIEFIVRNLTQICRIPICEVDADGRVLNRFITGDHAIPSFLQVMAHGMISKIQKEDVVIENYNSLPVSLCVYRSIEGQYFALGPVLYQPLSRMEERALNADLKKCSPEYKLCKISYAQFTASVKLFVFALDHRIVSPIEHSESSSDDNPEMVLSKDLLFYYMHQQDEHISNHSYAEEEYTQELIKNGDVERMEARMRNFHMIYPPVFPNEPIKTDKYMLIGTVSILARIAIEGGASAAESMRISDLLFQKIDQCRSSQDIMAVRKSAYVDFTRLVRSANSRGNINKYVKDCKKDIAARIFDKISLDDIASDLGIRKTYLAKLFSDAEGMSVGQYILNEKLKAAKDMLTYSDETISEIALRLGFSSQSYFGKLFRSSFGITPKEYRNHFHAPEY